jgi:hypothetical protein
LRPIEFVAEIGFAATRTSIRRLSMQARRFRYVTACAAVALATLLADAAPVHAARVGVLSNNKENETAADFNAKIAGHTFTAVDVSASTPSLVTLTANYDVLLLFEELTFSNATSVGNVVASFANTGRPVVLGTFYDQDRSDGSPLFSPNGWGALETIDPNTTDGVGTPYTARSLDAASIVAHPLTAGVSTLTSAGFAGGNQAKPGSIVVANWVQKNAKGNADPAIAYRLTGAACVIHVAIAPHYPTVAPTEFGGDFYRVWRNAFDFGAGGCKSSGGTISGNDLIAIPTLSAAALLLTALLIAAAGGIAHRRSRRS